MALTTDTVVCVPGLGGAAFDWDGVVRLLHDDYALVRYERNGLHPTLRGEADRLAEAAAGLPVVVAAHSVAAFHAEAFARLYPDLVCGLVLVDPSNEPRPPRPSRAKEALVRAAGRVLAPFAPLVGPPLRRAVVGRQSASGRDVGPREGIRERYGDPRTLRAAAAELAAYDRMAADLAALRRARPFPDVGLTVLSAPAAPEWRRRHEALARMSPQGRRIEVRPAGHMLHVDFPEVVAEAADELAQGLGRERSLGGR
ncbi:alpha/beta fold hydrolase [Nocardiopsis baichengensis]|uniref:alpha/beta fold hydrolase n=1 Tax=Nocardiopsis baichengensis TaxID=280240 RepID=UPI000346C8B4|nr:alpha/beta hydrolase [Nocardiopsis baichengensis]